MQERPGCRGRRKRNLASSASEVMMKSLWLSLSLISAGLLGRNTAAFADDAFEKEVRPLLVQHCIGCHGPKKQEAGLRLDSKAGWQVGGKHGPAIQPGKPEQSLLIKAIPGQDGLKPMPPTGRLTQREIAVLSRWIHDGANEPRDARTAQLGGMTMEAARNWWSFQPLQRAQPPRIAVT